MIRQSDKENSFLALNAIKINQLKKRKYKSLETKPYKKIFDDISYRQFSNSKLKIISDKLSNQQKDTPSFGINKINLVCNKQIPQNRQKKKSKPICVSFNLHDEMNVIQINSSRPLIKKSNRIPDVFFKAIYEDLKPIDQLNNVFRVKRYLKNEDQHKYLPELDLKRQNKFVDVKSKNTDYKLNKQQLNKLKPYFPENASKPVHTSIQIKARKLL